MYWELLALSSVFIVWRGGEKSYPAGMRYLAMHILSGVLLLAGLVIYGRATGSYEFNHLGIDVPGGKLMLAAIGIKAGFPFLHNWIQDAYPKSSVTGTVYSIHFHNQSRYLCACARLCRDRNFNLYWRHYDCLPRVFCGYGK